LRINGALKVAAGVTTIEEVLSVTPPPPASLAPPPAERSG